MEQLGASKPLILRDEVVAEPFEIYPHMVVGSKSSMQLRGEQKSRSSKRAVAR